ncbi:unnamed protein product, partial [marine sediment metagenome]
GEHLDQKVERANSLETLWPRVFALSLEPATSAKSKGVRPSKLLD